MREISLKSARAEQKARKGFGLKPILPYFEYHLADHCNLSCKGCSHFSPVRDERFAELDEYRSDLSQLKRLFSNVRKIELLGGEPLIHPKVVDFLLLSRSFFPKAAIGITTNGILLPRMSEEFWNACRSCSIHILYTVYPPFRKTESAIVKLAKSKGVRIIANQVTSFHGFYNKAGDTNVESAFKKCRSRFYCPMLRNGRLYVCCLSCNITVFNQHYGLHIPEDGFINIYENEITGWKIVERLERASPTCRFCTLGWDDVPIFPWKTSKGVLEDWDAVAIRANSSNKSLHF
ncbi:hypothetical protein MUP77_16495, partial [Candidatus Bathyarchaeota archaeon]|nr:hypothetical protein [Candidatus Bathyarchaeota archaeon]